jgi:hypothetical protein
MGWRGTIRTIVAVSRRIERENQRQLRAAQREQLRQSRQHEREVKAWNKERDLQMAEEEVQEHESLMDRLLGVHRECADNCDWTAIRDCAPPDPPQRSDGREAAAAAALDAYTPTLMDKLLGKADEKRGVLQNQLLHGRHLDEQLYQHFYAEYVKRHEEWAEQVKLATAILNGDLDAYRAAIEELNPFGDITEIGSSISFGFKHARFIEVEMKVNGEEIIPTESKRLLQSGKVSVKPIAKRQFYEIYQDYVCGCVFRIVREIFALLPVDHIVINALSDVLNSQTGHIEESTILSVYIPRSTANRLNWENLDPSNALKNFRHEMGFERGDGFHAVEPLSVAVEEV